MRGAVRVDSGAHEPVFGDVERFATRARGELVSAGVEGDALMQEVTSAASTLRRLLAHTALFPGRSKALAATVDELEDRLSRRELGVVIVGEKGAGETTFLDALIGNREIGLARGESRVLTLLRRGPAPDYRARFADGKVEEFSTRCPDRSAKLEAAALESAAKLAETEELALAAAARARATHAHKERARAEVAPRRAEREAARAGAARLDEELEATRQAAAGARPGSLRVESALALPPERPPAWWAFWVWLRFAWAFLFARDAWRERRRGERDRAQKERRVAELGTAAARAAATYVEERAALEPFVAELEKLRAELRRARKELGALRFERRARRNLAKQARIDLAGHRRERLSRFVAEIASLSDASGRGAGVVELSIEFPARFLPNDVILIDAPALTSSDPELERRAFEMIRERADGCILLSELDRGVGRETRRFLQCLKDVVPHVMLVLTKMDLAYVEANKRRQGDAWEQVEHARRIGTRRFAREIGRSPEAVMSLSVAAQAALDDESSKLGRRFDDETQKLFRLLRQERALILGTRSATAVRGLIQEVAEAEPRVARAYEALIAALEAKRIPEPEVFRAQALEEARPEIAVAAERATEAAVNALRDAFWLIRSDCVKHIEHASKRSELVGAARRCEKEIQSGILRAKAAARTELDAAIDGAVRGIELGIFDQLRTRYRLIHEVRRSATSLVEADFAIEAAPRSVPLSPAIQVALVADRRIRLGLGVGGAALGALLGWLIGGPFGALAGVMLGPVSTLVRTRAALVRRAMGQLDAALAREALVLRRELEDRRPALEAAIHAALDTAVSRAIQKFSRWMALPLEAERRAIETERQRLGELRELSTELADHDQRLSQLMQAARDASLGLCR